MELVVRVAAMNIFDFDNYKEFIRTRIANMPKSGRGQSRKLAEVLGIHPTMVTHIFRGSANLTIEGSLKLSRHWSLTELETQYLVVLVQRERAGDSQTQAYFEKQIQALRLQSMNLADRLGEKAQTLSELDRATFYSGWHFSAIRLVIATGVFKTAEMIAHALDLPISTVSQSLPKLISMGLIKFENGRYRIGPHRTYVEAESEWAKMHHSNWRRQSLAKLETVLSDELLFTSPVTLSKSDAKKIKKKIIKFIEEFRSITDPSTPEQLCCLMIDWRQISEGC